MYVACLSPGTSGGSVKVRDLSGHCEAVLEVEVSVAAVRVEGDVVIVAGEDGSLTRWSIRTRLKGPEFHGHRGFYPTGIQVEGHTLLDIVVYTQIHIHVQEK